MLTQMSIRNFALIEQMNISFNDGITIFTGETGAGKSILMDAFSILPFILRRYCWQVKKY